MRTVYMPTSFDDDAWRSSPNEWVDDLKERQLIADDGTAEFFVADILGVVDVDLEKDGAGPTAPEGTDQVVTLFEGDPDDQADTVGEIVARARESYADYDWPLQITFVFWRHHEKVQRLKVCEPSEVAA